MCVRCGLNLNHESTYYVYIESLEVIRLEKLKYKSTYKNMADNYKITLQFSTGNRKKSFFLVYLADAFQDLVLNIFLSLFFELFFVHRIVGFQLSIKI